MASADVDRFAAYYADKLWALLPEIYRTFDSDDPEVKGPLREMVDRIGTQAAVLRRSVDRAWEDQTIESCDDWVIPYIADLLATRLISGLDARAQRLDVARTVYYRRRKGTLAVLEQLAADITGWDARVVEMFRRVARARHGLDLEIGWPAPMDDTEAREAEKAEQVWGRVTRSPAHGFADLRSGQGARLSRTAFDELSYTPDVRAGAGRSGWYNIPRLGVFLHRLRSFAFQGVTPVHDASCEKRYSFDPTGRKIPLFAASTRSYGDDWIAPEAQDLPGPIDRLLWVEAKDDFYAELDEHGALVARSVGIYDSLSHLVAASGITTDPAENDTKAFIDPERGLLYLPTSAVLMSGSPLVSYHHGFSSEIGAGTYERRTPGEPDKFDGSSVTGGGAQLATAMGTAAGDDVIIIGDSLTYGSAPNTDVAALTLRANNRCRPLVRLPDGGSSATQWTFTGTGATARLVLDGLFVSGGEIKLAGEFEEVMIVASTLDPGAAGASSGTYASAVDARPLVPCRLRIGAQVKRLVIDRSIIGPIWVEGGAVESVRISDSIVQALGTDLAIDVGSPGVVELDQTTILGPVRVHRLSASASILHGLAEVADKQHSCVRYSAWTGDGSTPEKPAPFKVFESYSLLPGATIFTSREFGQPAYGQLAASAPSALKEGAEGGLEMGAFAREKSAIKERSLRAKLDEYMPVGLSPVFIHVT